MTKSKTILAGLGVVAALGVAALPLCSYAITGEVDLSVEVEPAIAMTIVSSGDNSESYYSESPASALSDNFGVTGDHAFDLSGNPRVVSSASTTMTPNNTNTSMSSVVTVYTNKAGHSLVVHTSGAMTGDPTGTIASIGNTAAALEVGTPSWGLHWDDTAQMESETPLFQNNGTTDMTITSSGAIGTTAKTITYGVATDADQAAATYTATVTYTATNAS